MLPAHLRAALSRGLSSTAAAAGAIPPLPAAGAAAPLRVFPSDTQRTGIDQLVGNTPLIRLRALSAATGCTVLGKAEWMNPGGSVKDRAALHLVACAERRGQLRPGGTVVEGTAGNTGIGLAHICAARGYKLIIYMPDTQSAEKMDLLRMLGAELRAVPAVPITDPRHYTFQARDAAAALPNAVWTNQFDNTDNREAHYLGTGPEIWTQTGGRLDAFVCATGTGGTLAGTGRYLKEASGGACKVYLADPPGSVLHAWVQHGRLERSGSSITEGIGQGRVTDNLAGTALDGSVLVEDERTVAAVFTLLREEGLFLGASSALNCVAAGDVARALGPGKTVVTVICDSAARYQGRLFSRKWLEGKGLWHAVPENCRHLVTLP
jgi:cysteine synthase A